MKPASASPTIYLIGPSSDLTGEGDLVISRLEDAHKRRGACLSLLFFFFWLFFF